MTKSTQEILKKRFIYDLVSGGTRCSSGAFSALALSA